MPKNPMRWAGWTGLISPHTSCYIYKADLSDLSKVTPVRRWQSGPNSNSQFSTQPPTTCFPEPFVHPRYLASTWWSILIFFPQEISLGDKISYNIAANPRLA